MNAKHVAVEHYLSHLYAALRTNKTSLDQLNSEIETLKTSGVTESNKKLREMLFQQAQRYVVIVLLANSLIEALANHYLANKCNTEQFETLECLSTLDKLVIIPKLFLKEYKLPKDQALYSDLKHLLSLRTSMLHSKPKVIVNGQIVHKGNIAKKERIKNLTPDKCLNLPFRLVEHLCLYDHGAAFELGIYCGFEAEATKKIILKVQTKSLDRRAAK